MELDLSGARLDEAKTLHVTFNFVCIVASIATCDTTF